MREIFARTGQDRDLRLPGIGMSLQSLTSRTIIHVDRARWSIRERCELGEGKAPTMTPLPP